MSAARGNPCTHCLRMSIGGTVQGVGFRPFVYRLATELGLTGWVCNSAQGVSLAVEGDLAVLQCFEQRLRLEKPPRATIHWLQSTLLAPQGYTAFTIQLSHVRGNTTVLVLPDFATCADCLHEIFDPHDRRYLYPFTNCTTCGPRFSIIEALPYDRANTTMRHFAMCQRCQAEYDDPRSRRFHAQPNACPQCGPSLAFWDHDGRTLASAHAALLEAPVQAFTPPELQVLRTMLEKHINTPRTSSVGRLFDAVAALLGLRQITTFEGQAAMELEFALDGVRTDATYPFQIEAQHAPLIIDWTPLVDALLADRRRQVGVGHITATFHNTLVEIIVAVTQRLAAKQVVLSGGCFHNRYLTERAVQRLRAEGFHPFWHQLVPPNDGGVALGQVIAVLRAEE